MALKDRIFSHIREGKNLNRFSDAVEFATSYTNDLISFMKRQCFISTAIDSALDDIGVLYKISRTEGENDASLRSRILIQALGLTSSGTTEELKEMISLLTGVSPSDIDIEDVKFTDDTDEYSGVVLVNIKGQLGQISFDEIKHLFAAGVIPFFNQTTVFNSDLDLSELYSITETTHAFVNISSIGDAL